MTAQDTRFAAAIVPHLKTLTRSERVGCSGGKHHHAITDTPDRSSTSDAAIVLDYAAMPRRIYTARRCLCAVSIDKRGRTMETARYSSWSSSSHSIYHYAIQSNPTLVSEPI